MRELVLDAWRMCVPKKVAAEYDGRHPRGSHPPSPPGWPGHAGGL
jgi:hypothetical protein